MSGRLPLERLAKLALAATATHRGPVPTKRHEDSPRGRTVGRNASEDAEAEGLRREFPELAA